MKEIIKKIIDSCDGWSTYEKAILLANLIKEKDIKVSVEIGVYGGKSLLPVSYVHKQYTNGMAYGIDPWDVESAYHIGFDESVNTWIKTINFDALFESVKTNIEKFDLKNHCTLLKMKSIDAVNKFSDGEIGLLHIDGNHGEQAVFDDIFFYLPKVKKNGIIWFDDVDICRTTTAKAISYAKEHCRVIKLIYNNMVLEKN